MTKQYPNKYIYKNNNNKNCTQMAKNTTNEHCFVQNKKKLHKNSNCDNYFMYGMYRVSVSVHEEYRSSQ